MKKRKKVTYTTSCNVPRWTPTMESNKRICDQFKCWKNCKLFAENFLITLKTYLWFVTFQDPLQLRNALLYGWKHNILLASCPVATMEHSLTYIHIFPSCL